MFSKRQLKWMGLDDPEKTKHFLPALSRKELGSFADEYHAERFDVEVRYRTSTAPVPQRYCQTSPMTTLCTASASA